MYKSKFAIDYKPQNLKIFHQKLTELSYVSLKNSENILELGIGIPKNQDLYVSNNIKNVYGIDNDQALVNYKGKINILCIDLNNGYDVITKRFKAVKGKIDHIICHSAIHYFVEYMENLCNIINYFLKTNGTFSFTCMNGKVVYNCLSKDDIKLNYKNNTYFSVNRNYEINEKFKTHGQRITVYVSSIGMKHTESLVNLSYLESFLKEKCSLSLIKNINGSDFAKSIDIYDHTLYTKLFIYQVYKKK